MQCAKCRHHNPAHAKFCQECGARLGLVCAKCGAELPLEAKFCIQCGQAAGAGAAQRFASPDAYLPRHLAERILTSRGALEGERKQVTVLFADLKGSMELLAERDPEDARKLLDPVLERMMNAVHHYEGTVNQVMGDGIMALFGAPLAHEDHAVRACYAALRMQDQVARYGAEMQRTQGVPVQIRVGLNSGEVVVRSVGSDLRTDYTAVGQTTHLAARMEQMARPGSVLATGGTVELAEGFVRVKPVGPVPVKGLDAPLEVYEVDAALPVRSRLHAAAARGLSPFVGRTPEMEHLRRALEQAGEGRGQVVTVVGEAGVGKSRLFFEFARSHRVQDWLALESSSLSYGKATSYLPIVELLRGYFQVEEVDPPQRVREKVTGRILTLDEALKSAIPPILALFDALAPEDPFRSIDPPQRRGRTIEALTRLWLRESQRQPLLLMFEDLHWTDAESLAALDALVEAMPASRVLLLTNCRPDFEERWGRRTYGLRVRLDPLAAASADELLDGLLGQGPGLAPLRALLKRRTGGNPLFLEESVRTLLETGALAGERGACRLARDVSVISVPATVQALLAARIDRLAPEAKNVLQCAAAIGTDVSWTLLEGIVEGGEGALRGALAELQAAEILYPTRLYPEAEYTFKHALTHDVAYGTLLQDRRRALHRKVAELIESRYAERLADFYEGLALHCYRGELWQRAARYDLAAAEKARERYAYPTAARFCERALEITAARGELIEERRRAFVQLGDLASLRGELEEANRWYGEALALAGGPVERRSIEAKRHRPKTTTRAGARLVYYEHGAGETTILLLNPLLYGLALFQPVLENLCQEFRVITMDPRGIGASDPVPEVYRLREHMEDVRAVIEASGAAPVVGVGVSRSGNVLVKLAAAYPQLVEKMVLVGTPLEDAGPESASRFPNELDEQVFGLLLEGRFEEAIPLFVATIITEPGTRDYVEQHVKSVARIPLVTLKSFFTLDPESNITPLLGQLRVPTLVAHGLEDRRVSLYAARYLTEHIEGAQFYGFEDRGHLPIFTATAEFCDVLRAFVRTGAVPARPVA